MHPQAHSTTPFGDKLGCNRELPVGSELMIAAALGAAGWWAIVRAVLWLAS